MVTKKSWEEFRSTGLLWWINMILHTFGWAICYEFDDGKIVEVYPARVKLGISHISDCCKGKRKIAGNFLWRYKDEVDK